MHTHIKPDQRRGRGASSNTVGRFEREKRGKIDDGWDIPEDAPQIRTELRVERPRKAITRNTSPDISFDRSLNPYRGCEHGCIYCFARPTHGYLGLSAGLDFETKLIARPEMPDVLAKELSAKRYRPAPIAIGTNTDAYQPVEIEQGIMRRILLILQEFNHPVTIATKGTLVERDIDILSDMAKLNLVRVGISVTTLDADLSRRMEPRVPPPKRRLATIKRLSEAGIPVRVMASPLVPGLTDSELEEILKQAKQAGAEAASWIMLRLPFEVSTLFRDWLQEHVPGRAAKVMARIREAHGGKDYDAEWGKRMRGEGEYAQMIAQRYALAVKRLGLSDKLPDLRCDLFRKPERPGDQLSLF